ncbi:MAG: TIR domain-containing protein [Acidobacteria bacterium]|nr:TIR domain-containing protein [Acidobacteriota bacterium]
MAHEVFISYSAKDKEAADKVCDALEAKGIKCWIAPRDIAPGATYAQAIINALTGSRLVILVFSSHTNESAHVESEIDNAYNNHVPIIRLRLENVPLSQSLNYYLSKTQWLDALTPPVEKHLGVLSDSVQSILGNDRAAPGTSDTHPSRQEKDSEADTLIRHPLSRSAKAQPPQETPSIAVLPFARMSADAEDEYFCDGLAEELLNALAKVEGLKVAARTSAFSFKGKNVPVGEIADALRVRAVLEGSVRRAGSRLRITVQLINVADGYHLWSERYDREMKDIFDVQDEITLAVVEALKVKLLGGAKSAVPKRHTNDPDAYELYLKGRFYYNNKHTPEGWAKALEFFDGAIEKDPEYASAYAAKSLCLGLIRYYGVLPSEALLEWRTMANRALELDGDLADAHLAKAVVYFHYEWDWAAAEREFRLTLELSPNYAYAHQLYGMFLGSRGRVEQALAEGRKALELDPLSLSAHFNVGWIYWFADRPDDMLEQVRMMLELEPNYFGAYFVMSAAYAARERYEESIEALQKSLSLGWNPLALGQLGELYAVGGRRDEARQALEQLLELRARQNINALSIARVYSGLGENDQALEWFERAVAERNMNLVFLEMETKVGAKNTMGQSVNDPRIVELLRRAGLISQAPG